MRIRFYRKEDCRGIIQLFYDTVHSVNTRDYTESQLTVWAPQIGQINLVVWNKSLSEHYTVVAEDII